MSVQGVSVGCVWVSVVAQYEQKSHGDCLCLSDCVSDCVYCVLCVVCGVGTVCVKSGCGVCLCLCLLKKHRHRAKVASHKKLRAANLLMLAPIRTVDFSTEQLGRCQKHVHLSMRLFFVRKSRVWKTGTRDFQDKTEGVCLRKRVIRETNRVRQCSTYTCTRCGKRSMQANIPGSCQVIGGCDKNGKMRVW